jgi:hypothetical protein
MNTINLRSPYIISIGDYGSNHSQSKVELSIYNKGVTPPTSGTGFYSLTKNIPSATQRGTNFNISNYAKEFIDNITPSLATAPADEDINQWVFINVTTYWYNNSTSTWTNLGTTTYNGVNGFTKYSDGVNLSSGLTLKLLTNKDITKQIYLNSVNSNDYINALCDLSGFGQKVDVVYSTIVPGVGAYSVTVSVLNGSSGTGNWNKKIPLTLYPSDLYFINDTTVTLNIYNSSPYTTPSLSYGFKTKLIPEYKYKSVKCSFINHYGGWETLIFFKQQTNSIAVKGTDYKLMPSALTYNTSKGQVKTFNINGTQTIKLNTGFVDQNYSELITDLLLSETVLLDSKPVTVKTQGSDLKTNLKDRLINYEIEFEYAYNLINDVV